MWIKNRLERFHLEKEKEGRKRTERKVGWAMCTVSVPNDVYGGNRRWQGSDSRNVPRTRHGDADVANCYRSPAVSRSVTSSDSWRGGLFQYLHENDRYRILSRSFNRCCWNFNPSPAQEPPSPPPLDFHPLSLMLLRRFQGVFIMVRSCTIMKKKIMWKFGYVTGTIKHRRFSSVVHGWRKEDIEGKLWTDKNEGRKATLDCRWLKVAW